MLDILQRLRSICLLSCHTLLVTALILITLVSWTVAVRAALVDTSGTIPSMYPSASTPLSNRIALRVESFMATLWLSFLGLLSLGAAAACLSFGPRDQEHGKHCKMV